MFSAEGLCFLWSVKAATTWNEQRVYTETGFIVCFIKYFTYQIVFKNVEKNVSDYTE